MALHTVVGRDSANTRRRIVCIGQGASDGDCDGWAKYTLNTNTQHTILRGTILCNVTVNQFTARQ